MKIENPDDYRVYDEVFQSLEIYGAIFWIFSSPA
jgi:hypothetical protein